MSDGSTPLLAGDGKPLRRRGERPPGVLGAAQPPWVDAAVPGGTPTFSRPGGPGWGTRRAAWAAGALAGTAYLYLVDPNQPGHYLPCPTYALTGTYCPGCGGLRSAHALLHGDVAASLGYNPAVLPLLAFLVVWGVRWWQRGRPRVSLTTSGWRFRLVLALVGVFWVARNVPGWDWLSPA